MALSNLVHPPPPHPGTLLALTLPRSHSLSFASALSLSAPPSLALSLARARRYGTGAQILADLGIGDMRLMSNNPKKFTGLTGYGLRIVERVPSLTAPNPDNLQYLETKRSRMGHMIELDDEGEMMSDGVGSEDGEEEAAAAAAAAAAEAEAQEELGEA